MHFQIPTNQNLQITLEIKCENLAFVCSPTQVSVDLFMSTSISWATRKALNLMCAQGYCGHPYRNTSERSSYLRTRGGEGRLGFAGFTEADEEDGEGFRAGLGRRSRSHLLPCRWSRSHLLRSRCRRRRRRRESEARVCRRIARASLVETGE